MRPRLLAGLSTLVAGSVALVGLTPSPAAAENDDARRTPAPQVRATPSSTADALRAAAGVGGPEAEPLDMPTSYPSQPRLRIYPDNRPDASDAAGLLGHDDLAPLLTDWMRQSSRLSTQVVGRSTEGRDLYLVTVTAPETEEETAQQTAWREEVREDPAAAADDEALQAGYKTPLWISANIHGNEWEGTDAAMRTIRRLVTAPWREVGDLLREHRLYFSLTLNPDGRTAGTRATALGLDENRDMITNATPESQSFVRTAQAVQPLYAADFHGYTDVLQVEPCGPPHGENYEYDLYLPHNYAMARAVERAVVAADIPGNTYYDVKNDEVVKKNTAKRTAHIKIPYRDTPSGWDDYPPIFTAQYGAFYGAATSTVELPLYRPETDAQSPANARVNRAVAVETMSAMLDYFDDHADAMLDDQIGVFARGVAGEPKDSLTRDEVAAVPGPGGWKKHWDVADDQDPVDLPRAYVIPVGDDQRSASDAERLVEQLVFHDVEVGTLDDDVAVDGTTYPAGSYVVDMHQPLRGLANSLLDLGTDISEKVPFMYDISAWSLSYLWGADVAKVGATTDEPIGATTPVDGPVSDAAAPDADHLTLDLAGVADYQALNALLRSGVPVAMLPDGQGVVGPLDDGNDGDAAAVADVADTYDVPFRASTDEEVAALDDPDTRALQDLTIAVAGSQDDVLALTELGFDDLVAVTSAGVQDDPTLLTDTDLLWVGEGFALPDGEARAAVQAWVDEGHAIVGRTAKALRTTQTYGLASASFDRGFAYSNGIVSLETPEGSPLAPYAQDSAFVYPATWFSDLGPGTTSAQTYGTPAFLAGHWPDSKKRGSQEDAAGQTSVLAGEAESGARSVVFGTWVFFRTHMKGGMSQAARAIFWAAPEAP